MSDVPFVLAVLGDFGGRCASTRFHTVDRDRLDTVMDRLGVVFEEHLPDGDWPGAEPLALSLEIRCLDDLHPDRIVTRIPALAALRTAREAPPDAAALQRLCGSVRSSDPHQSVPFREPTPLPSNGRALLDRILASAGGPSAGALRLPPALGEFVRAITEPTLDRTDHALQAAWRRAIDRLLGDQLRALLYHPRFQALEAAWRGVSELVNATETGPNLIIRLLDLPRHEIATDFARCASVEDSLLGELICGDVNTPGGTPYAAIIADYSFGPPDEDLSILKAVAQIAARVGAPFIAAAEPGLLGLRTFTELGDGDVRARIGVGDALETWRRFRRSPEARHVALCLPRVLLRLPYGPGGAPADSFSFDEALTADDHERYLWGSPALAFARILTRAFAQDGWDFEPSADTGLEGLPLHVFLAEGEEQVIPCAEVVMSDATVRRVAEEGFITLASFRGRDDARFYGVQTVAGTSFPIVRPH